MGHQRQSPVLPTLAAGVLATFLMLAPLTGCARATAASSSASSSQATATLRHEPQGTATLMWHPAGATLTVTLALTGLAPSSAHMARLRCAACSPNQPGSLVALDTVTADQFGNATSTTTIPGVAQGIPVRGWVIEVLNGTTLTNPQAAVRIASGAISNPQAVTHQPQKAVVALHGTSDANQSASGTSHLQIAHDTLVVTIALRGLAPGSLHAAHVHLGSCARQGPVAYGSDDLKADASGHASATMRFAHVSSIPQRGWYINVHDGPMAQLASPLAFDPIACGDVVTH
jgi:Cu/Zn superoxide dismutase